MLDLNNKSSNDKADCSANMDDGGRCVLINDSKTPQPLFGSTSSTSVKATAKKDATVGAANKPKMETTTTKKEVKARKSTVVATKSSPGSSLPTVDMNGKVPTMATVNTFPIGLQQGQLQSQPLTLVPSSMGLMSLTGSLPINAQSVSIHPQHQTITLTSSSAMNPGTNSSTIRAPTPTLLPQAQFQIGPRPMTVHLPQQLLMQGMQMGQPGLSQFVLASRNPNSSPSLQSGPMLQLIQTSQGTQIIKANPPTSIQQIASTATTTTTTTSNSKSRSNKQILPKPQNSSVSTASTLSKSTTLQSNSNNAKLIQQQTSTPTFGAQTFNSNSGLGGSHQIVVGPQGTFLVNNGMLPNIGSQPFFIQGNGLQNGPVQLAIRPQAPLFVNNNTITGDSSNLGISLTNNAQFSAGKPVMQANQQQTFVISNASGPANGASGNLINLRNGTQNLIFRPQFPPVQQPPQQQFLQIQTANGPMLVALPPQPHLAQQPTIIQQPAPPANPPPQTIQVGNTVYSLASNPNLNLQSGAHNLPTILTHPQQDICSIANQSSIMQSNIATSISTSTSSFVFSNSITNRSITLQPPEILPKNQSNMQVAPNQQSPKTSSSKGLNLADLLKETGILSDFSPPTSPKNSLPSTNTADISLPQPPSAPAVAASEAPPMLPTVGNNQSAVLMVQGGALNAHQNVLIANNNNNSNNTINNGTSTQPLTTSQLRVTIGPDGTLLVVSPAANTANATPPTGQFALATLAGKGPLKDSSGIGSSQPSPDSTTPSLDTSTSSPSTTAPQSVSSLISLPTSTVEQMPVQTLSRPLDAALNEGKPTTAAILLDTSLNQLVVKRAEQVTPTAVKGVRSTICDTNKAATPANSDPTSLHLIPSSATLTSQKAKSISEPIRLAPSGIAVPLALPPMLGMVTLADVTGVPLLQVNSANAEFMSRLDAQIKTMSSQSSFTQPQLDLLKELKNIQDTILRPTNSLGLAMQLNLSNSAQQLLQLSTIKSNGMQILITQSQNQQCLSNGIQIPANVSNLVLPSATTAELVKTTVANSAVSVKVSTNSQVASTLTVQSLAKTSTQPQNQVKAEPEKLRPNVPKAIHQQLNADQNAALHPDCKTSFRSQDDAFKRLLRYHVFDWPSPSEKDIEKFDESYEKISQLFLRQKSQLYDKFRYLLLRESMNEVPKYDQILINRLFVEDETNALKTDREMVSSGKSLNLPPLPESWVHQQREKEKEKEQSLKRKLSTTEFDDDFEDRQAEKVDIADICNMLEEEHILSNDDLNNNKNNDHILNILMPSDLHLDSQRNRDIECVDKLIDQFNSQGEAAVASGLIDSDHQSFLDSLDTVPLEHGLMSNDDLEAFYSRIEDSSQLDESPSPWSNTNLNCSATNSTLQQGILLGGTVTEESNSRMAWNAGFNMAETEAAVAVQSIMSSHEETSLSVDLSGIDDLDAAMGVEGSVNFDDVVAGGNALVVDETSFLNSETLAQQPQPGFDKQMDCAIKSIMGDIGPMTSSQSISQYGSQSQSFNQFMDTSMANSTGYNNLPYHMSSHQMMPSNMRGSSMIVNDSMLDEAVKSILS